MSVGRNLSIDTSPEPQCCVPIFLIFFSSKCHIPRPPPAIQVPLPSPGNGRPASFRTTQTIRRGRTRAWKSASAPGRSNNDSRRRDPRRCVSRAICSRDVHQRDRNGYHHRVLLAFSCTFGEGENAYQGLGVFPHLRGHVREVFSLCLVAFLSCISHSSTSKPSHLILPDGYHNTTQHNIPPIDPFLGLNGQISDGDYLRGMVEDLGAGLWQLGR